MFYLQKKVLKAFKAKEAAYKKLEKELGEVIEYDSGEEIIAASTIYAFASQDVADTLSKASIPPELMTPDEIQQYKQVLETQAEPYKKKALQGFKLALSKAKELEIYKQWYFAANQYMAILDPTFVDRGEVTMPFRSIDWMGL